MSPQVTFKSSDDKVPQGPQGGALVDAAGKPVPPAPRLRDAVRTAFAPTHGRAPEEMPQPPVGLEDLGAAAALRVTGPEREKWLQGMQTADVGAVPFGGALAAAFLAGKGKLVAVGLVWRYPEELIVTTASDRFDALSAHLDKLLIMEDCEIEPAEGPRRLRYLPGDVPPERVPDEIVGSQQPLGLELLLPEERAQQLLDLIRERPRPDQVEALRVALGVPAWGPDLDEDVTPIEAGLDRMISFAKGCYVGQEVVAMATYRGRVSWNLVRAEVRGEAPAPGSRIDPQKTGAGRRGRVTSATQIGGLGLFLGYVHKERIVPGSTLQLEDGRTATVLGLPYGSQPGAGVCA